MAMTGSIAMFRGLRIRLWKHREIQGRFRSGNFSQDARGHRDLELRLAVAQRQGRKRQIQTIHAKIAHRRKDALHPFSRAVVNRSGAVLVGTISSTGQIASGAAKAAHDGSWSMLRTFLKDKSDPAGVAFAEVDEAYATQACSGCLALSGPQGLAVRPWVGSDCGSVHDRDQNAALNMARLGCETLGLKGLASRAL
jgi:transposase